MLVASCVGTDDPVVVPVSGAVGAPIGLTAEPTPQGASHRWELAEAPDGAEPQTPSGDGSVVFTAPLRGVYVIDHWLEDHLAELLTHHFVVTVVGAPPVARIEQVGDAPVGASLTLDGANSASDEGLPLGYEWRLAMRPRDSATTLGSVDQSTVTLVPDVAGVYQVQLDVFDGELWSAETAASVIEVP